MDAEPAESPYWRRTRRSTAVLLGLWLAVTFGVALIAADLEFRFFGWPFGFWAAAQGALIAYLLIVCGYAWWMERLEDRMSAD